MYGVVGGLSVRCETISVGFSLYVKASVIRARLVTMHVPTKSPQSPAAWTALCSKGRLIAWSVPWSRFKQEYKDDRTVYQTGW